MKKPLFILGLLSCTNCFAEHITKIAYQYYHVTPLNSEGLKDAASIATPIRHKDKKFLGNTFWRHHWTYKYNTNRKHCFITQLTLTTDITITLPKLTNARLKQQKLFDAYLIKLQAHETNHAKLALQYNDNLERALKQIKPRTSCAQLDRVINNTAKQYSKALKQANARYDKQTNHGATEGVALKNN